MIASVTTFAVHGIDSRRVIVEVDVPNNGLSAFTIVGLPDRAVRESRERVRAALKNSGFVFPDGRITVNLAPADVRRPVQSSTSRSRSGPSARVGRYRRNRRSATRFAASFR